MTRRVVVWDVLADGKEHKIGGGKLLFVTTRKILPGEPGYNLIGVVYKLVVWTEEVYSEYRGEGPESGFVPSAVRPVVVVGTGVDIPEEYYNHLGSAIAPGVEFAWHLYGK